MPISARSLCEQTREPLAQLTLRGLDVRVESEDGDLVLVLDDGEVLVTLEQGAGGRYDQAVDGLERLATAAGELAEQLRALRGRAEIHPTGGWVSGSCASR